MAWVPAPEGFTLPLSVLAIFCMVISEITLNFETRPAKKGQSKPGFLGKSSHKHQYPLMAGATLSLVLNLWLGELKVAVFYHAILKFVVLNTFMR